MRMNRMAFFLLAILAGIGLGLWVGWGLAPVRYSAFGPDALRQDYRTDIVLMTAEIYEVEGDLAMALAQLAFLGDDSPKAQVQNAIAFAQDAGYSPDDLARMLILSEDIGKLNLEGE